MLVATPAQTAAYPLHSSTITSTTTTGSAAATTSKLLNNNNNNSLHSHSHKHKLTESSGASRASALMKTLSVRLNRGTEFLKGTVQKALVSTTTTTTTSHSNSHSHSHSNQPNSNHATAPTASSISSADFSATNSYNSTVTTSAATSSAATSTLARTIAKATTVSSLHKLYTVPPTATHRYPEDRKHAGSIDSLHREMCHFKPIRAVPTTPWKCSSRSRGACLRIPKASLATNLTLNPNCDDERNVDDDDDNNGSDNDDDNSSNSSTNNVKVKHSAAYKLYRPKPSSNLIISSPTHQSAFVCLVSAEMKNISASVISKSKSRQLSRPKISTKSDLHKTRNSRGRTKSTRNIGSRTRPKSNNAPSTATLGTNGTRSLMLRNGRNPLVPVKKINLPDDMIMSRSLRNMRSKVSTPSAQATINMAISKTNKKSNNKSTTNIGIKQSRMVNIVKLAQEQRQRQNSDINTRVVETKRSVRKRKIPNDLNVFDVDIQPQAPKSARLSMAGGRRDGVGNSNTMSAATRKHYNASQQTLTITTRPRRTGVTDSNGSSSSRQNLANRCSPPLTRSRLKEMSHGKLFAALDYRHRVI